MLVIKAMIGQSNRERSKLKTLPLRIKQELSLFEKISLFHHKLELNDKVDPWAKLAIEINPRTIINNGEMTFRLVP
jgi:hypothetical protein